MAKTTTMRGTCPACFHKHDSNNGLVHRHGWSEQGGRRVGEYGRAWHTGACFGAGRKPFEASPEGTWAFLAEVVYPAALADGADVAHLLTRPVLTVSYTFDTGVRDTGVRYWRTAKETRSVLLAPGATVKVSTGTNAWDVRTLTYEHEWNALLHNAEASWKAVKEEGSRLYSAAVGWKAAVLAAKPAKLATVHLAGRHGLALCTGWRTRGYRKVTTDPEAVTCVRCRKHNA
jgi:hypothetical protein